VIPDDVAALDWDKGGGLLPAVVQHARTGRVLMLGYMNEAALRETLVRGRVVFYSRSRQSLWTKGETSGHFLNVVDVSTDCDSDALLVLADPIGPHLPQGHGILLRRRDARRRAAPRLPRSAREHHRKPNCRPAGGKLHGTAVRRGTGPHRTEGGRGRRRDRACGGVARRRRAGERVRGPGLPPAAAAQVPRPLARTRGRGTQGAARLEGLASASISAAASAVIAAAAAKAVADPSACHRLPKITAPGRTSTPLVR